MYKIDGCEIVPIQMAMDVTSGLSFVVKRSDIVRANNSVNNILARGKCPLFYVSVINVGGEVFRSMYLYPVAYSTTLGEEDVGEVVMPVVKIEAADEEEGFVDTQLVFNLSATGDTMSKLFLAGEVVPIEIIE